MAVKKDFFNAKAADYDKTKNRTLNVENIAHGILKQISFSKDMHIMDFGSGTGLLLSKIAPYVKKITAIDISTAMNNVLREKKINCPVEILEIDITTTKINETFDSIISSMTFHHINDVAKLFRKFYSLLNDKGTIAVADLDTEDGSFHTTDTGVFHHGFNREQFTKFASDAGFQKITIKSISMVEKPTGNYPVFLLTAKK